MMIETKRAIARGVARYLIEQFGQEIENMTVGEVLADELPGLDDDVFDEVRDLVHGYIEASRVHVSFDDGRVRDDGTVKTQAEMLSEIDSMVQQL